MKSKFIFFYIQIIFLIPLFHSQTCLNEDFELSTAASISSSNQIQGWTVTAGYSNVNINNCNFTACCPQSPSASAILNVNSGYIDPIIGSSYPIYSVFGGGTPNSAAAAANPNIGVPMLGSKVLRLNNSVLTTYGIEKISRSVSVNSTNCIFDIAFIGVMATGHACCDASGFMFSINGNTCNVGSYCTNVPSNILYYISGTTQTVSTFASSVYNKWTIRSLDLSQYMGQTITIDLFAAHCTTGAHYGYVYLDTRCNSASIKVNGQSTPLNPSATTSIVSCSNSATLTAPSTFLNYQWTGPSGFSSSSTSVIATVAGNYTLSMGYGTPCSMHTKVFNLSFVSPLQVTSSSNTVCAGGSVTLSVNGTSNQTWTPGNSTASAVVMQPNASTQYTVTGTLTNGCVSSGTIAINTISGSPFIFSSSANSICPGASASLTVSGALSQTWTPGALTASNIVVNPVTSTVYTVVGTATNGCSQNAQYTLFVSPSPCNISVVSSSAMITVGDSATLTAFGLSSYTWNTGNTGPSMVVKPIVNTSYTVQGFNNNGFFGKASITQSVQSSNINQLVENKAESEILRLYPVPNKGEFNVYVSENLKGTLIIENGLAQVIYKQELSAGITAIKLKPCQAGIYYYRFVQQDKTRCKGKFSIE